ncbi:lysophospholipase [Polaromonas sp. P1(28)-8]|nr:lysophospholipase [Polaromonas sp. P1(28)-8]
MNQHAPGTKLAIGCLTWLLVQVCSAGSIGGPLRLSDEGIFFVGGRSVETKFAGVSPLGPVPPGTIVVDQMFVHYRIPETPGSKVPIVLVPGGGLTGASYETTPDGREGWATYFVRKGYPVYVVDTPGRGRAGFNSSPFNQARIEGDIKALPTNVLMLTGELSWSLVRFGPRFGTSFPGMQFPIESMTAFAAQGVPLAETTLDGGGMKTTSTGLAALLDKIGPSIVVVHSLSGPYADSLVALRPGLVRAVVDVEGSQAVTPTDQQIAAYSGVPLLELFGDYLTAPVNTAGPRLSARSAVVERINQVNGGRATLVKLPDVGIHGNSHMMMQDRNNLEVANYILKWLSENVR